MNDNSELHFLHNSLFGEELEELDKADDVLNALRYGETDITMKLPWYEDAEDPFHTIILKELIDNERVLFYNPQGHSEDLTEGDVIEKGPDGPERIVEGIGLESVSLEEFKKFFEDENTVAFVAFPEGEYEEEYPEAN